MTSGLLDTSIFIASEAGRPLGPLPDRVALSVVTLGELELAVLAASDDDVRARRADTLTPSWSGPVSSAGSLAGSCSRSRGSVRCSRRTRGIRSSCALSAPLCWSATA
ncbi:conserved hypothetical protein [Nostocoides jenkinsii Ben 74]|uniref:PIN domain-containing protein n=1 Tax=Nostocoides jenkinsii Ben 74 TaxID=1193518 RepID=A0A077M9V3_9MICO|nr:conserved hypothetical protein [Tetrasphaera jenkinsii Ben 74]